MESETKENNLDFQMSQDEEDVNLQNEVENNKIVEDKQINEDNTVRIEKEIYEKLVLTEEIYEFLNSKEFLDNIRSDKKDQPLHVASALGNLDIVQKLIKKGHNVNVRNADDETPLHRAVINSHLDIVKFLVENKAFIGAQDNLNCYTPLHMAVSNYYNIKIVQYLCSLEDSFHLHIKNINRRTPLSLACNYGHQECVKIIQNRLKF